jgi:formylglycine-generating enzyme required for sulfatase activity
MKKSLFYFTLLLLFGACTNSKDNSKNETAVTKQDSIETKPPTERPKMGMVFNEKSYEKVPKKETLKLSFYEKLPASFSLKDYCPKVENQKYGTCVGWSTAYYALTILYAQKQGLKNIDKITEHAFSPGFVYRATTKQLGSVDNDCERGTDIGEALNILQNKGVILLKDFPDECYQGNISSFFQKANAHKIKTFMRLSDKAEGVDIQLKKIKKSISDGFPVVIGIETMPSFMACTTAVWTAKENELSLGGHALCMIGYDDNKVGGAFLIVNSWGESWADKGFVWMRYADYFKYTICAFEVEGNNSTESGDIAMVYVQGGTFTMGCTSEQDFNDCRQPTHQVSLSSFQIGKYEVTQAEWEAVMGSNPSKFKGCPNCPVESVSWNDIQDFIIRLKAKTGKKYRLPTEAEWEYAARGGNRSRGNKYSGSNNFDEVAWHSHTSGNKTHLVAGKKPNELGIYDMSGNVYEWCSDWYGDYSSSSKTNPNGPSSGSNRVLRGGSWYFNPQACRVSDRSYFDPVSRINDIGFRLVLVP